MEMIKPCPFCGGEGQMKNVPMKGTSLRQGWVGCRKCGCLISWKISPSGAIKKWNSRPGEAQHE